MAEEDFIQKIYNVAVNGMQFQQTHKNKKDQTDDDRMYEYFDQVCPLFQLKVRRAVLDPAGLPIEEGDQKGVHYGREEDPPQ